jgi:hypothetical protein
MKTDLIGKEDPIQTAGMKGTAIIIHEVGVAALNIIVMNIHQGIIIQRKPIISNTQR